MLNHCRPQDELANSIRAYDFSIHDLELYLDSHPCDTRALCLRENLIAERKECVKKYETMFGRYVVTSREAGNSDRWDWICGPWPWEYQAN